MFPKNIKFFCDNYVLESDDLLEFAQQEFDTIMCLSTTKWIHLNFGDDGLKRAFKRMHAQLRPGGTLILEPQGLSSYARKVRRLTPKIQKNYREMKFKPDQFSDYLVNEVGFSEGKIVAVPEHASAGFRRPIHVSIKYFHHKATLKFFFLCFSYLRNRPWWKQKNPPPSWKASNG